MLVHMCPVLICLFLSLDKQETVQDSRGHMTRLHVACLDKLDKQSLSRQARLHGVCFFNSSFK